MQITDKSSGWEQPHISDEDLLLFSDGEAATKRAADIQRHLGACWECRTRLLELQNAIADFVHLHQKRFENGIPPVDGPRALLRAQLQRQERRRAPTPWSRVKTMQVHQWVWTAAAALLVVAPVLLLGVRHSRQVSGADGSKPNASLTPGATVATTAGEVCAAAVHAEPVALPDPVRREVFERYGMTNPREADFEVDYLITADLGGAASLENLWPEPYNEKVWNARVKDELESHLRTLVCSGKLELETAQHDIASDWIAAYRKYFRTNVPRHGAPPLAALFAFLITAPPSATQGPAVR